MGNPNSKIFQVEVVEKTKFWKDYKFWLPLFISVGTLALTIVISYNLHSPFKLELFSQIYLRPNAVADGKKYKKETLIISIPILFLNKGQEPGVVRDVYIDVRYNDKERSFSKVRPAAEIDPQSSLSDCKPKIPNFAFEPFVLGGQTQVKKRFLFGGFGDIKEGEYVVDLYIETDVGVKKMNGTTFSLNSEMKNNYLSGNTLAILHGLPKTIYGVIECSK